MNKCTILLLLCVVTLIFACSTYYPKPDNDLKTRSVQYDLKYQIKEFLPLQNSIKIELKELVSLDKSVLDIGKQSTNIINGIHYKYSLAYLFNQIPYDATTLYPIRGDLSKLYKYLLQTSECGEVGKIIIPCIAYTSAEKELENYTFNYGQDYFYDFYIINKNIESIQNSISTDFLYKTYCKNKTNDNVICNKLINYPSINIDYKYIILPIRRPWLNKYLLSYMLNVTGSPVLKNFYYLDSIVLLDYSQEIDSPNGYLIIGYLLDNTYEY